MVARRSRAAPRDAIRRNGRAGTSAVRDRTRRVQYAGVLPSRLTRVAAAALANLAAMTLRCPRGACRGARAVRGAGCAPLLASCGGGDDCARRRRRRESRRRRAERAGGGAATATGSTCNLPDFRAEPARAASTRCARSGADCGIHGVFGAAAPVAWNDQLTARGRRAIPQDMAAQNYFSHTSADGRTLADRVNADRLCLERLGENIAAGYPSVERGDGRLDRQPRPLREPHEHRRSPRSASPAFPAPPATPTRPTGRWISAGRAERPAARSGPLDRRGCCRCGPPRAGRRPRCRSGRPRRAAAAPASPRSGASSRASPAVEARRQDRAGAVLAAIGVVGDHDQVAAGEARRASTAEIRVDRSTGGTVDWNASRFLRVVDRVAVRALARLGSASSDGERTGRLSRVLRMVDPAVTSTREHSAKRACLSCPPGGSAARRDRRSSRRAAAVARALPCAASDDAITPPPRQTSPS